MPSIQTVAETGSTNADLLSRLAIGEQLIEGCWLIADRQTAGRGRQGRQWLDAPGNFMGSTAVRLNTPDPPPASLSFVAALAVYETLLSRLPDQRLLRLKWPNDVQLGGAKFCGILLEREGDYTVIGIGINLAAAPAVPDRETRSIAQHASVPDRDALAGALAAQFSLELSRWREFGVEPIFTRWLSAAHPIGTPLSVHNRQGNQVSGTFAGLEPDGAMRLCLAGGSHCVIHAGDIELEAP